MSTKISISYQKKNYDLEFSRTTAGQIEDMGFVLEQLSEKPNKMIPLLFYGAFLKHNRSIKPQQTNEIWDNLVKKTDDGDESGIIGVLAEMYADTVNTLTDSKTEDEGNAAVWKVVKG